MNWSWPNFTFDEMACKGSGECEMNPEFMDRLQALRDALGVPLPVTSGYRSREYNARVSTTGRTGPHTTGRAADIHIAGADAHKLIGLAYELGFTGFGVKQSGPWAGRFIHLDDLQGEKRPRVWSY